MWRCLRQPRGALVSAAKRRDSQDVSLKAPYAVMKSFLISSTTVVNLNLDRPLFAVVIDNEAILLAKRRRRLITTQCFRWQHAHNLSHPAVVDAPSARVLRELGVETHNKSMVSADSVRGSHRASHESSVRMRRAVNAIRNQTAKLAGEVNCWNRGDTLLVGYCGGNFLPAFAEGRFISRCARRRFWLHI